MTRSTTLVGLAWLSVLALAPAASATSLQIVAPLAGATVEPRGVAAIADLAGGPVTGVRYTVDGAVIALDRQSPYHVRMDAAALGEGTHTLRAVALDSGGATLATAPAVTFNVRGRPTTPTALAATVAGDVVSLTWSASSSRYGIAQYRVYRDGVMVVTSPGDTPSAADRAPCGVTHSYAVTALDNGGRLSLRSAALTVAAWSCSDSTPPSQPGGLTTTGVTATTVDLAWSAATDDVGVTGYLVDRSGAAIGTTAGLGFTVTGLACNSGYTFDVSARDAAGNSSSAATVIVRTAACSDTTAPTMPPALATSAVSQTGLTLSWQASTDAVGVTGYAVSRNGSQIATPSGTTVAVSGLSCASTYAFAVTAHDAAGNVSAAATTSQATTGCAGTASRYVAASGSDAGSCTASAPCRSLDRAYHVAAPGELVEVAGGTYPLQTINADGTKTSSTDVVFQPAAGATATLAGVSFAGARHLTLQGFHLSGWWGESAGGVADVTMRDIVSSAGFEISGADSVSVIGGSYGPVFGTLGAAPYNHVGGGSTNTLIDGVYFHDFTRSSSDVHMECLHVSSADGLTIRNSRFFNCAVFDIFLTYWSGPVTRNITIENNFFDRSRDLNGACCGYYAVQSHLDGTYSNLLIRNNSSTMAFLIVGNLSNTRMVGNVGPYYQNDCQPNITYSHNVWQGAACGSTDVNAASGFVNPGTLDLHLLPGSAAIGRGDPANYPGTDIDGDARPLGGSIDAGADER